MKQAKISSAAILEFRLLVLRRDSMMGANVDAPAREFGEWLFFAQNVRSSGGGVSGFDFSHLRYDVWCVCEIRPDGVTTGDLTIGDGCRR